MAGLASLLFVVASCEGVNRRTNALDWHTVPDLTHYYHHGISPGPTLITDAAGAKVEERRHEPFGQPIPRVDVAAEPQNILGKLTNPNTGWSYHGARWMQPQTARWTAPDPAVKGLTAGTLASNLNPYAYAVQSPTTYWDPDGLAAIEVGTGTFKGERGDTASHVGLQTGFSEKIIREWNPGVFDHGSLHGGEAINIPRTDRIAMLQEAAKTYNSTQWSYGVSNGAFKAGSWKCATWIGDMMHRATNYNPERVGIFSGKVTPVTANVWASKDPLPGTRLVSWAYAKAGDVFAWARPYIDASGHSAVFIGSLSLVDKTGACLNCAARDTGGGVGFISPGRDWVHYMSRKQMDDPPTGSDYGVIDAVIRRIDTGPPPKQ